MEWCKNDLPLVYNAWIKQNARAMFNATGGVTLVQEQRMPGKAPCQLSAGKIEANI